MITLSKALLNKIERHAEATYPEECCGAIIGRFDSKTNMKVVTDCIEMDNVSTENKKRRFMIKPEEYTRVEGIAESRGDTLLGFYHSHPDHPPLPSDTDNACAWPYFSYLITSIDEGLIKDTFSYTLDLETMTLNNEVLKLSH